MGEGSPLRDRAAGVLLHPSSLPGPWGIGDLGASAHAFVDWLAEAGQSAWQLLPLVAVDESGSPYNGLSAFAGNPLLVDPEGLVREGLLEPGRLRGEWASAERVDYPRVLRWKDGILRQAHRALRAGAAPHLHEPFERYRADNAGWLEDYALFRALRDRFGGASWTAWEPALRRRDAQALAEWRELLAERVDHYAFQQFLFDRQWAELREHARGRGVRIVGDLPIFVAHDSADVWANPELFLLDERGEPRVVSGVPPDYFSETGQRWGNPLYRWGCLRERGFAWWVERFRRTLEWVDVVRIDHFRGFESYWEIPAGEQTAIHGEWRPGPGRELFSVLERELGGLPMIAEDLGLITPEVEALRDELGLPGMRVLQFAFDGDPSNPHLPENHPPNSVAYTGTHDNDTIVGWWARLPAEQREQARVRIAETDEPVPWAFVAMVFRSPAQLAVVPVQDLLGLGSDARMNTPGTPADNWSWRMAPGELAAPLGRRLRELTRRSGRLPRQEHPQPVGAIR